MSRSLTKEMRVATREVHKLSDALVNAKLAFGELMRKFFVNEASFHEKFFSFE